MNEQKIEEFLETNQSANKKEGKDKEDFPSNPVASTLFVIGIIEIAACFFIGMYQGIPEKSYEDYRWGLAFIWWVAGFVSGMMFIGFAEIIKLLHNINEKDNKGNKSTE